MKILAPYHRKVSVKSLHVLMNDFEVRELLFRCEKQNRDVSANLSCRNFTYYLGFVFGFLQTG